MTNKKKSLAELVSREATKYSQAAKEELTIEDIMNLDPKQRKEIMRGLERIKRGETIKIEINREGDKVKRSYMISRKAVSIIDVLAKDKDGVKVHDYSEIVEEAIWALAEKRGLV